MKELALQTLYKLVKGSRQILDDLKFVHYRNGVKSFAKTKKLVLMIPSYHLH